MLVEPAWLQKNLGDPNLRIVDGRSKDKYAEGHVPGAVRVDVGEWKALALKEGGLHDTKAWSKKVGRLGVNRETQVVVYGGPVPNTARIWWLLKYVGLEDVSILNGGWDWWTKQDSPTETRSPKIAASTFEPEFQADRLEEIDTLKKSLKAEKVKVVDTRSTGEFTGKVVRGERGGHIPGATHLEWKELLADDGRFKTKKQLKELFRKRGILPDETAVCY